jgi:hypothetical protein
MRLQLPSEIDRRLNEAIKAEPDMLEQLKASYFETGRTVDDLILILSNKYKELTT